MFKKLWDSAIQLLNNIQINKNILNFDKPFNSQATIDDVVYAYRLILKRFPDNEGFQHYKKHIEAGMTLDKLITGFLQSTEYKKKLETEEEITAVDIGGKFIYARLSDQDVGGEIIKNRQHEPHITRILSSLLNEGNTFVDIGANIGYFTVLGASVVGDKGKVIAIEPNPDNIQLIFASIVKNRFRNIDVLPYAASDCESIFEMVIGSSNGHLVNTKNPTEYSVFTQSIILDEQLARYQNINVVKIDVEGHELKAIRGFKKILKKLLPTIITEFHPKALREFGGNEPEEYLSELFGLYNSVSIILSDDNIKKAWDYKEIMEYWIDINEVNQTGDMMHLDLIASVD
ncbi:FkbM family methyltransferase [Fischerella sp. PCC 9605]|uniref:FkbM family methyltransferase n=1 Tax=Fischerella sp. PCC 9605 TaxID=1173024 RepID=UPI00047A16EF|nr:FkbM family methyltransferase [Fischerella sp. PCC 9605]